MTFSTKNSEQKPLIGTDSTQTDVQELTLAEQDWVGGGAVTTEYAILIGL